MNYSETKLRKNINLSYVLVFLQNSFFWYAPWLLFLLNYITFPQAAVIQSIGLLTSVLVEIPTGALADLLGKKKTLNLAFLITGIGEIYIAFGTTYVQFLISYIILHIGYSFYSGTMEAFTYDSLVSGKKEDSYNSVVSKTHAISDAGLAISSLAGGLLYGYWIGMPFFATGVAKLIAFIISFFIDEPLVDTDKFSFSTFKKQTVLGFRHLFNKYFAGFTTLLLTFSIFHVAADEILDDITIIAFGYDAKAIGVLYSAAILVAIPSSLLYEKVSKRIKPIYIMYISVFVLALHYVFSHWISTLVWTIFFFIRVIYSPLRSNALSEIINKHTPSNIRATTLSTYSMLKAIPFVVLSGYIGIAAEKIGVKTFDTIFFSIMLLLTVPQIYLLIKKRFEANFYSSLEIKSATLNHDFNSA